MTDNARPPRGYSWAPFEPGNQVGVQFEAGNEVNLTHGAWSKRRVEPLAAELTDELLALAAHPGAQVAYLADPSYALAIGRWSRLEARVELLRTWLDDRTDPVTGWPGDLDEAGEVRPAADLLVKLEAQAAKAGERLGLDPLSRSKLGRDVAATQADLAQVSAAGHAALAGRADIVVEPEEPEPEEVEADPDEPDDTLDDTDGTLFEGAP